MWKNFGKAVLFLLIFVILFLGISPVFVPKNNSVQAGIHVPSAKGFLAEEPDSLEVLFLGDSEAYASFIPLKIWEEYGITSYVCSRPNQRLFQTESYMHWFFKNQSPKVVVLETNTFYREFTLAELLKHNLEERFPYLRYHDRWKILTAEDWTDPVQFTDIVRDKGFVYATEVVPAELENYMAPDENIEPLPPMNMGYIRRIQAYCRERGAELILVSIPSPTNWSSAKHNGVEQVAQALGLQYMDFNLMPREIPIDWERETTDGGDHLNYEGACKVTEYMGAYLWNSNLFTDKRQNERYQNWNENLADFIDSIT